MARTDKTSAEGFAALNRTAILGGQEADRVEPRADRTIYDRERDLVLVILQGGFAFGFPPGAVEGLSDAPPEELSQVRVSPSGDGLHWDNLDVDVSLTGLMTGALNLRGWAPRILGQIRSEAKARAARKNGRKGGRPRTRPGPKKSRAGSLEG